MLRWIGLGCVFTIVGGGSGAARADEVLRGEVPSGGPEYHLVPFEVPAGIAEIEIRHPRLSEENVLDYGLYDPAGYRGWGGGNVEPIIVGALEASRSYLPGEITPGTWNVVIGKAQIKTTPLYELEIILRREATLAPAPERAPYVPAVLSSEARWYAGDFHVHSRQSGDASATFEEIAVYARMRGLDFVVITDHNTNAQVDFLADVQARHPDLLFIPGVELTTYAGHANGIDVTQVIDHRVGLGGVDVTTIADAVHAQGGVFSINHPVLDLGDLCIGCAWRHELDVTKVDAVELGTGAGSVLFIEQALEFWDDQLRRGGRSAAIGGSDDHRAGQDMGPLSGRIGSPATMVYAEELSARAIAEGVRRGRTVVKLLGPNDPMIELAVGEGSVDVSVSGGMGATLRWVKNGRGLAQSEINAEVFSASLDVAAPESGEDRYRAEVLIDGSVRSVSSHVFVGMTESGCGCSSLRGRADRAARGPAAWLIALALSARWCTSRRLGGRRRQRRIRPLSQIAAGSARVSSLVQFVSQVLPPSVENACSQCARSGPCLIQMKRTLTGRPSSSS